MGAPAGRAHFARLVSHLIPVFGLAALAGALGGLLLGESASSLLTALLPLKTAHANTIHNTDRLTFSAGDNHACGIRNGALYCWGDNTYGQSGTGGTTTPVPNMTSGVTAVDAGARHTCAIRNGALYCWGDNSYGQSGTGGTTTPVPNMTSGVTAVDAGAYHTCAIRNGALLCWGYNNRG
jgi:alpha-tubulin suppressor-like RCC1 family protein